MPGTKEHGTAVPLSIFFLLIFQFILKNWRNDAHEDWVWVEVPFYWALEQGPTVHYDYHTIGWNKVELGAKNNNIDTKGRELLQ